MNTVKEFQKAGLVFVVGDEGDGCHINNPVSFSQHGLWQDAKLKSFAWRTNTGVKPEFNGDVEYELKSGHRGVCKISMLGFSSGAMDPLIKWRPHLAESSIETPEEKEVFDKMKPYDSDAHVSDASKVKPVFTQAMADNSAFKAGDYVSLLSPKGVTQSKAKFLLVGFDIDGHAVVQHDCSKNISIQSESYLIAPIDTRTDKEKAVDEGMELIGYEKGGEAESNLNKLYDLWVKK
jgi:hypothetical protein